MDIFGFSLCCEDKGYIPRGILGFDNMLWPRAKLGSSICTRIPLLLSCSSRQGKASVCILLRAVHGEEPQRHSQHLPLFVFGCVKRWNNLHNDSPAVAVLSELADTITGMACTGRFYILGPPVQLYDEVLFVVGYVNWV